VKGGNPWLFGQFLKAEFEGRKMREKWRVCVGPREFQQALELYTKELATYVPSNQISADSPPNPNSQSSRVALKGDAADRSDPKISPRTYLRPPQTELQLPYRAEPLQPSNDRPPPPAPFSDRQICS
jgi:hypothetical protein